MNIRMGFTPLSSIVNPSGLARTELLRVSKHGVNRTNCHGVIELAGMACSMPWTN